jgi:large subunit ribosomal protein L17
MSHRHGYKGRKFGRETDQRRSLVKGLADSLIIREKIETTHAKAKDLVPFVEKLITRAKSGTLHDRRIVLSRMSTKDAGNKLVDEIAPKLLGRTSGHLRVTRTRVRRGDNTQMASVEFVDDLKSAPVAKAAQSVVVPKTATTKKPAAEKKPAKTAAPKKGDK